MKKMGTLYYASDKAVFDALLQKKFKNIDLKELFLDRGIFLSEHTDRKDVALYFSQMNHDFYDHQRISDILGSGSRKDPTSIVVAKGVKSREKLEEAISNAAEEEKRNGDDARFYSTNRGFDVELNYTDIDYTKSEFKQVEKKTSVISFEFDGENVLIRGVQNEHVDSARERILQELEKNLDMKVEKEKFDLSDISRPETRTQFFDYLISGLKGFDVFDVSEVFVVDSEEDEGEDPKIKKVSLSGKRVSSSSELIRFHKKGFYTWKIKWRVESISTTVMYDIEAQFKNQKECKEFSYCILGAYRRKIHTVALGLNEYKTAREKLNVDEKLGLSRTIEKSAQEAFFNIREAISKESDAFSEILEGESEES